jgi:hypothetical protein
VLGLALVGSGALGEYRGWFLSRPAQLQNVPKSIRDNPGAWRSLYANSPRTFGGK